MIRKFEVKKEHKSEEETLSSPDIVSSFGYLRRIWRTFYIQKESKPD